MYFRRKLEEGTAQVSHFHLDVGTQFRQWHQWQPSFPFLPLKSITNEIVNLQLKFLVSDSFHVFRQHDFESYNSVLMMFSVSSEPCIFLHYTCANIDIVTVASNIPNCLCELSDLPDKQQDECHNPQDILVWFVLGRLISMGQLAAFQPTELWPCQQNKPQKEPGQESTNMSKVISMWQYPDCHVDRDYKEKSYYGCNLQQPINLISKKRFQATKYIEENVCGFLSISDLVGVNSPVHKQLRKHRTKQPK